MQGQLTAMRPAVRSIGSRDSAQPGQDGAAGASPVITEGVWFDRVGQPLTLRMELPLSCEELVAALYGCAFHPDELAADEAVWGFAAVAVTQYGMTAIERAADEIVSGERHRTIANPAWLAFLRRRVAELTGEGASL